MSAPPTFAANPIWLRELRHSTRLTRTPWLLALMTTLMTLLVAGIGGVISAESSPASTGALLFQVFFSTAYFMVTLVGTTVASSSIASERDGQTWEAVILTGLSPTAIGRGKFLAASTSVAMYIVALAPVGALPFLFGGVTATEVFMAFVFLFLIGLLSVAFGLAVSSKMETRWAAVVVTLMLIVPASLVAFATCGPGLSAAAHRTWPCIPEGTPIWLPIAFERARFDVVSVAFLLVGPVIAIVMPTWLLYEVTIANLTSETDDRANGLKRWFLVAVPTLVACGALPALTASSSTRLLASTGGVAAMLGFLSFCVFLFAGDPIGPSRRVVAGWNRKGASRFRRFLGPGVTRSSALILVAGIAGLTVLTGMGMFIALSSGGRADALSVAAFGGYALGFFVFITGLGAYLRTRMATALAARVVLFALLFAVVVGPWIFAGIGGLVADHRSREAMILGAPSPFYVFVMLDALGRGGGGAEVLAGMACAVGWAMLGVLFLVLADRRSSAIIQRHQTVLAETDRVLAEEDAPTPPDPTSPGAAPVLAEG